MPLSLSVYMCVRCIYALCLNDIVSIQVPRCGFRVIHFQASDPSAQLICQWAREWDLAHQFELSALNALKLSGKEVEQWFERRTGKNMYTLECIYKSERVITASLLRQAYEDFKI